MYYYPIEAVFNGKTLEYEIVLARPEHERTFKMRRRKINSRTYELRLQHPQSDDYEVILGQVRIIDDSKILYQLSTASFIAATNHQSEAEQMLLNRYMSRTR